MEPEPEVQTEPEVQSILGIASYTEELPNFDSSEPPENNEQDIQGNLVSVLVVSSRTVFATQDANSSNSSYFVTTDAWVSPTLLLRDGGDIKHSTLVWAPVEVD